MIDLRVATISDLPRMFKWRNQALVFQGLYDQSVPLVWGKHLKWWANLSANQQYFIILLDGKPVGVVSITHLDTHCPEVGYYVGEIPLWGKGIGTEAVRLALNWLETQGYGSCCASAFQSNKASIRVLEKSGFHYVGVSTRPSYSAKGLYLYYEQKPLLPVRGREE